MIRTRRVIDKQECHKDRCEDRCKDRQCLAAQVARRAKKYTPPCGGRTQRFNGCDLLKVSHPESIQSLFAPETRPGNGKNGSLLLVLR